MTTQVEFRSPEHLQKVRAAVQGYADVRQRVHSEGGDLGGEEVMHARSQMFASIDVDPSDFDLDDRWRTLSLESEKYPNIAVHPAANFIAEHQAQRQQRMTTERRNLGIKENLAESRTLPAQSTVEPGHYRYVDGEIRKISDRAPELVRYHGAVMPEGEIIDRFNLSPGHEGSENRPSIGVTPAVYTTTKIEAAEDYALGYTSTNAFYDEGYQGQLYTVRIRPRTVLDLGDCQDDGAAYDAIGQGYDVIECPDFWEQPETIVFDPDLIEVERVHPITVAPKNKAEHEWTPDPDGNIDQRKALGYLGDPIYDHSREAMLSAAVEEYRESKASGEVDTTSALPAKSMEYRGAPKQPTYSPRDGRGRMRY